MSLRRKAAQFDAAASLPCPEAWVIGERAAFYVVTGRNHHSYYAHPPQDADFDKYLYLVASLGIKANPGYTIKISRVKREKDTITAEVMTSQPSPLQVLPQVLVIPTAVARIPRASLPPDTLLNFVFVSGKGELLARLAEVI